MSLKFSYSRCHARRLQFHLLIQEQLSLEQGAGNNSADTLYGEPAVDKEPRGPDIRPLNIVGEYRIESGEDLRYSLAGEARDRDNGFVRKNASLQAIADIVTLQLDHVVFDKILLGQGDQPGFDTEEFDYAEMFLGLRHPAVVSGYHKNNRVYTAHASHHVADKSFVPGNIDHADRSSRRQIEPGETEIDGHSAFLFLGQTIGIDSGHPGDQRRFAVIDMTGCA